jgi:hypothetical protein
MNDPSGFGVAQLQYVDGPSYKLFPSTSSTLYRNALGNIMDQTFAPESGTSPHNSRTMYTEENTQYQYTRLSTITRQIRLLKIQRSPDEDLHDKLQFALHVFDFDTAPSYRTLSYMWGTSPVSAQIAIDGKPFSVLPNLYNFLDLYSSRDVDGYIWIDSICIDQSFVEERNAQVAMMDKIYAKGREVIIWLGLDGSEDRAYSRWTQEVLTDFHDYPESEELKAAGLQLGPWTRDTYAKYDYLSSDSRSTVLRYLKWLETTHLPPTKGRLLKLRKFEADGGVEVI